MTSSAEFHFSFRVVVSVVLAGLLSLSLEGQKENQERETIHEDYVIHRLEWMAPAHRVKNQQHLSHCVYSVRTNNWQNGDT